MRRGRLRSSAVRTAIPAALLLPRGTVAAPAGAVRSGSPRARQAARARRLP